MKYQKSKHSFAKAIGSLGFYTIIFCCLAAIGIASYIAVTKFKAIDTEPKTEQSNPSYIDNQSTYSNNTPSVSEAEKPSSEVQKPESSIPYESPKSVTSEKEVISFVFPVENGKLLKGYSDTVLQYSSTYGDMRLHLGLDITCNKNSMVKSCAKGTVKTVSENSELGRFIEIEHPNGITIKYCGLGSVNVKSGDSVLAGDIIGSVGTVTSECSDVSHIHIEAYENSKQINPSTIIATK